MTLKALRIALAATLGLTITTTTHAQHRPYPAAYTGEQILADFAVFEAAIREAHSGLHVFRTPEEVDRLFAEARASLEDARSERELHLALSRVIAAVQDGHTEAMLSQAALEYMYRQPAFLPFRLAFIGDRAYLHRDLSPDSGHLIGAELVAINGVLTADILAKMLAHTRGDGRSTRGRYYTLGDEVAFGRLYQLLYGPTDTFLLAVATPNGREEVSVPAITRAEIDLRLEQRYSHLNEIPYLDLRYPEEEEHTAILRIGYFGGGPYEDFIERSFRELTAEGVRHLIVDLRGNGGGLEIYGQQLIAHLVDRPFAFYDRVEVNARRFSAYDHSANTATVYNSEEAEALPNGKFALTARRRSFLGAQQPRQPHFAGGLYVLIDGGSFSTTADVCAALDRHARAVFIGEETGGNYHGNTSGNDMTLYLPHTKTRVRIPLERYYNATRGSRPKDRGLIPDHAVVPTVDDLVKGTDAVLEYALELIRKGG